MIFRKLKKPSTLQVKIKTEKVFNLTINNKHTDVEIRVIRTIRDKFSSLITTRAIEPRQGFLIRNSRAFNSIGLTYSTDVIFCNKNFEIIETIANFGQQKISRYYPSCHFIYVLSQGMLELLNINIGDLAKIK